MHNITDVRPRWTAWTVVWGGWNVFALQLVMQVCTANGDGDGNAFNMQFTCKHAG